MARNTSVAFRRAVFAQQTNEVFLILLELYHASIGPPTTLYFVNNYTNITSNGQEYIAFPFNIILPADTAEEDVRVQLSIDNVNRSIVEKIRSISGPPTVIIKVVLASQPDTIEFGPVTMKLRNVTWDDFIISGDLVINEIGDEPIPGRDYTPQNFAGLF